MIGSLRGNVLEQVPHHDKGVGEVLLEVSGVGYVVTVTIADLSSLSANTEVFLYIYHHIREADQKLFGFLQKDARAAFEILMNAHGVGPALALAILSTHPVASLSGIVAREDVAALCEVPGVGKKTAQRLVVELASRFVLPSLDTPVVEGSVGVAGSSAVLVDVKQALENLGYSSEEVRSCVAGLPEDVVSTGDSGKVLKVALRSLAGK